MTPLLFAASGLVACAGGGTVGGLPPDLSCTAESDASFCTRLATVCGAVTANDNCGSARTVASCGSCSGAQTCTNNQCATACAAETDAQLCTGLGFACGSVTATDNCSTSRTVVSCGRCARGKTCTNNVCGSNACTAETDGAFCSRLGKACGSLTADDNCGTSRTVASCGACLGTETCSANACVPNSCTPETDQAFCTRLARNCGTVTANDNCGTSRIVASCGGSCPTGQLCTSNVCTAPGQTARPVYNTGHGFFTLNGKLYDPNGVEFNIVGVDTCHYDENWASCTSNCGIPNSRSNVIRTGLPLWSSSSNTQTITDVMDLTVAQHMIPMPGVWSINGTYDDAHSVTCQEDSGPGSTFATAVAQWVARYSLFQPYERYMLLNIANEWGPSNSAAWRDAYIGAVATLRAAGYGCTLVIDSGGCGQNLGDLVNYAQAVYDSDPQKNIVFSIHIYGYWATQAIGIESWQTDLYEGLDALQATGLPIIIGEFGPGKNVGASPTMLTPGEIIQAANARHLGWLAWAWDDGYGSGDTGFVLSNQGAFSLTNGVPTHGSYPNNSDLSAFGNEVVLNPTYGTFATAQPATCF